MVRVSFVLPAYKGRFLREAIASILAQTYCEFELVVVDDCSPDDLKAIADEFRDPRLTYHRNEMNLGGRDLVAAWQHALSFAQGEWCVLAGDDDIYAPRFLDEMLSLSEKYPDADVIHCRSFVADAEGKPFSASLPKRERESDIELVYMRVVAHSPQFVPEFMFRKSRLEAIGGFVRFPRAWYSDDATWALMAAGNGCVNCNEPLYSFRCSGLNISTAYRHVPELVEAGRQYCLWLQEWTKVVRPQTPTEEMMLSAIAENLERRVLSVIYQEMHRASWSEWWRVIVHSPIPCGWKVRTVRDGILRTLRLR